MLIVDDEAAIVAGLEKLLSEIEFCELDIYKAFLARDAIKIAMEVQIDILLTDINMPGMTGLELSDTISGFNPRCKIIYLTGFSNFDYIYSAMNKIGNQYILKSESDSKISDAIKRAIELIETETKDFVIRAKMKQQEQENDSLLKQSLLQKIINGSVQSRQINELFTKYHLSVSPYKKSYLFIGNVSFTDCVDNKEYWESTKQLYQVKMLLDEKFYNDFFFESLLCEDGNLVWILQEKHQVNIHRYFSTIAEEYQNIIQQMIGGIFSVSFLTNKEDTEKIASEYNFMKTYMRRNIEFNIPMIYNLTDCDRDIISSEQEPQIQKLEKYIVDNIGGDISLTRLAAIIHFNPSYLSRFYKKNKGINLSEFTSNVKISKASEILRLTDKRVSDIATSLGFDTTSAFCSFFKKKVGVSPAQYRLQG